MQPKYFRIEQNGVKFRAIGVVNALEQHELCLSKSALGSHEYFFLPDLGEDLGLFEVKARFRKLKHAKRAIREAYGYNIEIREPEFH